MDHPGPDWGDIRGDMCDATKLTARHLRVLTRAFTLTAASVVVLLLLPAGALASGPVSGLPAPAEQALQLANRIASQANEPAGAPAPAISVPPSAGVVSSSGATPAAVSSPQPQPRLAGSVAAG